MPAIEPPLGRFHPVDGHNLLLHAAGAGSPAAVLLAGGGAVGLDYLLAQRDIAEFTTGVVYDRAGTGWSDRSQSPARTGTEVTDELCALLKAADVPGPYVLVGHSLGADYARIFAIRFPEQVVGLVLAEPDHEDYNAFMPAELAAIYESFDADQALPDELPAESARTLPFPVRPGDGRMATRDPRALDRVPPQSRMAADRLRRGRGRPRTARGTACRRAATRPAADHPDRHILTSTHSKRRSPARSPKRCSAARSTAGKIRLYEQFAASVPRGENRLVDGVGHVTLPMQPSRRPRPSSPRHHRPPK